MAAVVMGAIDPQSKVAQGRDADRITDMKQIASALETYYSVNSAFPQTTEPYNGWERSECNSAGCGTAPAPFMEYLAPDYLKSTMEDPARGTIDSNAEVWGYLYRPGGPGGNQTFCLLAHLEDENNQLLENDGNCDDALGPVLGVPAERWWYAIDNVGGD